MRGYLKLFAALCVVAVCFGILRTDDGRKMWLSQKLAWAEAYGSPADVQRALEEFDTAYAAASGNLHLIAFRARWRRSIERHMAAGMSYRQAARQAVENVGDGCTCGDGEPVRGGDGTYTCAVPASGDGATTDIRRPCPRRDDSPAPNGEPDD